jgi:hypothetical protein
MNITKLPDLLEPPQRPIRQARRCTSFCTNVRTRTEAQAPQPDHNVHDGAQKSGDDHHLLGMRGCPGQIVLWVSQRFTKTAAVIWPMAVFIGDCENTGVASKF